MATACAESSSIFQGFRTGKFPIWHTGIADIHARITGIIFAYRSGSHVIASSPDRELPRTESLKDAIGRVMPYWECIIFPALMYKDSLLVVAHGNSLRGIIKHLKGISDTDISNLNLPTAVPYVFEFDDRLVLVKDYYLGNPEEIRKRTKAVAEQGMIRR